MRPCLVLGMTWLLIKEQDFNVSCIHDVLIV